MTDPLALVAPGAMGAALGARLVAHGVPVLTALEGRSASSRARAEAAGLRVVATGELMQARWFLSVVPPAQAMPLAREFAGWCQGVARPPVFVDLNAINPDTAVQVQAVIEAAGARFVDGCILGFPPKGDAPGPTIYLSDDAAELATLLQAHGLQARTLRGGVGAASALKMAYAGINKGVALLGAAMALAAQRHDAGDALRAALGQTHPALLAQLDHALPDLLPKARRWAPEMEEIAAFIGPERPEAGIYTALAAHCRALADDLDGAGEAAAVLRAFPAT